MKILGTCLVFSLMTFSLAGYFPGETRVAGLRCYKCADVSGTCTIIQNCNQEDACLSLSDKTGKTIRQCIRYTDCDNSRLAHMFPTASGFTYRCCNSNLCNSSPAATVSKPLLGLLATLVVIWCSMF